MTQVAPAEAKVGSFNPLVLARILKHAASPEQTQTCRLHVVSGPSVKTVGFQRGALRFASSNIRRDRLGESMLAHEFISASDFRAASDAMKERGCRFGEALLSLGRLTEDELKRELAIQAQRIVLSLFRTDEGTYRFDATPDNEHEQTPSLPVGLPVTPLLLKGLRAIRDGKLILTELPPAEARVRVAKQPAYAIDANKLLPAERSVLERAGDGASIGELIRNSELGRVDAFRSCFALLSLGFLERVPVEGAAGTDDAVVDPAVEKGRGPSGFGTLENIVVAPDAPIGTEARTEHSDEPCRDIIERQFERLDAVSEESLLGVRDGITPEELKPAYDALKAEWNEVRERTRDVQLLSKLEAIELRLAAAYAQVLFQRQAAVSAPEEPVASAGPPRAVVLDPARRRRLEELERDCDIHFQVRDWGGAISLLHELVALQPDNARYHTQLGTAMQHHSSSRHNAEQHFIEAAKLSPNDASVRLDLARYYRLIGNHARSRTELGKVLELDPKNEEARKLMTVSKTKTPMRRLLSKVFG